MQDSHRHRDVNNSPFSCTRTREVQLFLTANLSSAYNKKLILVLNMYMFTSSIQSQTTPPNYLGLDRNILPTQKLNNIHPRKTNSQFEVGLQVVRIFFWSCTGYNGHIRVCQNWSINTCIWSKFVKWSIYLRITHKIAGKKQIMKASIVEVLKTFTHYGTYHIFRQKRDSIG